MNKPKMAGFLKFKFLKPFKINFNGGRGSILYINIKIWLFQKVGKSQIKIVKFEVENLKLKNCVQIHELIKIIHANIVSRTKIVWHWGAGLRIAYSNTCKNIIKI